MPDKRLTIEDIARLAGVSKATISRVLNRKPDVDPATRERILRLVEEQSFVPSATATGLAGGRSPLIGMLVRSYTWLFIPEIMRAVADLIDETAYELVLYRMNDRLPVPDGSLAIHRLLATNLTAGVLAVFPGEASVDLALLSREGVPLVVIDDQYLHTELPWGKLPIPWIAGESHDGAYEAVRHLIAHGHRRIAHIQGTMRYRCARDRHAGYCQAMTEAGLPIDSILVREGDFNAPSGQAAASVLFALPPEQRPTAIFASSDLMAYGVLEAAREFGVQIPGEVALVGFDDLADIAETIIGMPPAHLPLTTVRQPFYKMGRYAMEQLLALLGPQPAPEYRLRSWPGAFDQSPLFPGVQQPSETIVRIQLPVTLIVRDSCGCLSSPLSTADARLIGAPE